jgi:hypothetical protein
VARSAQAARPRVAATTEPIGRVRARARAPRLAVFALVGLFAVSGFVRTFIVRPHPVGPAGKTTVAPAARVDVNGFAQAFARAYLTVNAARVDGHAAALRPFLGGDVDPDAGFSTDGRTTQRVSWTAAVGQDQVAPNRTVVTVAVALDAQAPLRYLAVPVDRTRDGALVIDAFPSFVGPPRRATHFRAPTQGDVQDAALLAVSKRALANYLAGAAQNLSADLDRGVALSTPGEGLALQSVDSTTWAGPGRVDVQLVARGEGDETYTLRYELAVVKRDRWYVRSLNPAVQVAVEKGAAP